MAKTGKQTIEIRAENSFAKPQKHAQLLVPHNIWSLSQQCNSASVT